MFGRGRQRLRIRSTQLVKLLGLMDGGFRHPANTSPKVKSKSSSRKSMAFRVVTSNANCNRTVGAPRKAPPKRGVRRIVVCNCGRRYLPIVSEIRRRLSITSCTIDGEAVILRPDGHSNFFAPAPDRGSQGKVGALAASGPGRADIQPGDCRRRGARLRTCVPARRRGCREQACGLAVSVGAMCGVVQDTLPELQAVASGCGRSGGGKSLYSIAYAPPGTRGQSQAGQWMMAMPEDICPFLSPINISCLTAWYLTYGVLRR
jgi:hypothetical protein